MLNIEKRHEQDGDKKDWFTRGIIDKIDEHENRLQNIERKISKLYDDVGRIRESLARYDVVYKIVIAILIGVVLNIIISLFHYLNLFSLFER